MAIQCFFNHPYWRVTHIFSFSAQRSTPASIFNVGEQALGYLSPLYWSSIHENHTFYFNIFQAKLAIAYLGCPSQAALFFNWGLTAHFLISNGLTWSSNKHKCNIFILVWDSVGEGLSIWSDLLPLLLSMIHE